MYRLRAHTTRRDIHGAHVAPHNSATMTYTPQDYATPPIPTFAIDFARTKTYHQHTLIYTTTSPASTEQTPTIIAPNAKSRKRNSASQATSQTIDRQLATQTHPPPQTSNAPHSNSSSRDTNAGADAYLKESIALTTHSTAPTPQPCNPVTPIDNGSMVPFLAPTTLSVRQPTTTTGGSTTLTTAPTHTITVVHKTPRHTSRTRATNPPPPTFSRLRTRIPTSI